MSSLEEEDEDYESIEPTFKDAKEECEFGLKHYQEFAEMEDYHFKWKYKKGRNPDVLAFLILSESERRKFQN